MSALLLVVTCLCYTIREMPRFCPTFALVGISLIPNVIRNYGQIVTAVNTIQLINQSIKARDALASLGYPDRCLRCDGRPSTPVLCNAEQ